MRGVCHALAAGLTALLALRAAAGPSGAPRLACDEPVFDFGQAESGKRIEHTFVLRNTGDAPLSIDRVRAGCSCTSHRLERSLVPPGGRTTLAVEVSLKGRIGGQRISLYVHSNDPDQPFFKLQCNGFAGPEVDVFPEEIVLDIDPAAGPSERIATIMNRSASPVSITGVRVSGGSFTARIETNEVYREFRVVACLDTNRPPRAFTGEIMLETDHPRVRHLSIPVQAVRP